MTEPAYNAQQVELLVNEVFVENMRQYMALHGSSDAKRPNSWCEYGFPSNITNEMLYNMYDRTGLAYGTVNILHEKCWETNPEIIEGGEEEEDKALTAWDKAIAQVFENADLFDQFSVADLYRMVMGWSGLLLQYQDGGKWTDPVKGTEKNLIKAIPAWAIQLTPGDIDGNVESSTYGEVQNWQFKEAALTNQNTQTSSLAARQLTVHKDRILILGDWRNGRSMIRACYNNFISIEKIEGGSGESFLKNAARQIGMNFDKDVKLEAIAKAYGVPMDQFQKIIDKTARSFNMGVDSILMTQGADVKAITANVPDPSPHYNTNLQTISASVRIPAKVIVGMQTGERASTEDIKQFNKRAQGRRIKEINKDMKGLVKKLAEARVIPAIEQFTISWDDLSASSTTERLADADVMAKINKQEELTGPVFSKEEIRDAAGYDNEDVPEPLPEADPAEPVGE
jgi:hypothetical protein